MFSPACTLLVLSIDTVFPKWFALRQGKIEQELLDLIISWRLEVITSEIHKISSMHELPVRAKGILTHQYIFAHKSRIDMHQLERIVSDTF